MMAAHNSGGFAVTERELNTLRHAIAQHEFLWINDEDGSGEGLSVHDRRPEIGRNLGTWISSAESLDYLVRHGAEAWCQSQFNGGEQQ
jgi:hypothetical protein